MDRLCIRAGDAAVYALNTPALHNNLARPKGDRGLTREVIDSRVQGHFDRYFFCNRHEVIGLGEPTEMHDRLIAQSGTVVVQSTGLLLAFSTTTRAARNCCTK